VVSQNKNLSRPISQAELAKAGHRFTDSRVRDKLGGLCSTENNAAPATDEHPRTRDRDINPNHSLVSTYCNIYTFPNPSYDTYPGYKSGSGDAIVGR
jgi:hypothetical protein